MDATEDSSLLPTDPEVDPTPSTSSLPLPAGPTPAPAASPAPPSSAAPITVATTFQNGTTRTWSLFYFHPHTPSTPLPALTDSYFSPTPSELQTAFAGQVAKREQLVDRPLLTRALREKEAGTKMEEKRKRWPETRIRIRFADRSLVECAMKSTDLLGAVYEMVKATLREDVRGKPFLLCEYFAGGARGMWGGELTRRSSADQTPPKTEFRRADPKLKGKNLLDLEFTPAAVLYFKFEDEELNGSSCFLPLCLRPFYLVLSAQIICANRPVEASSTPPARPQLRRIPPPPADVRPKRG